VRYFEVIVIDPKKQSDFKGLPKNISAKLSDKKLGKYWPKTAFTDATLETVYGGIGKSKLYADRKSYFRQMRREMKEKTTELKDSKYSPSDSTDGDYKQSEDISNTEELKVFTDLDAEEWTSAKGSTIMATLVRANSKKAVFLLASGKEITTTASQLTNDSWQRVLDKLQ